MYLSVGYQQRSAGRVWYSSPSQLKQHDLHVEVALPLGKTGQFGRVDLADISSRILATNVLEPYLSRSSINTREIDPGDELQIGRVVWIVGAAVDLDTVYAILMNALSASVSDVQ